MRLRLAFLGLASILVATATARAQGTANFKFLDGGAFTNQQPAGPYAAGQVYVGPYNGQETINGDTRTLFLYCVDFSHDIKPSDTWTANLTGLGLGADLSRTRHGAELDALTKYREAAWLTTQYALHPTRANLEGIQDAMWNIFLGSSSQIAYGAQWLSNAQAAARATRPFDGMDFTYFQVVTDKASPGKQEFLIYSTPEPASLVLVGTGLLGVLGFARRQKKTEA